MLRVCYVASLEAKRSSLQLTKIGKFSSVILWNHQGSWLQGIHNCQQVNYRLYPLDPNILQDRMATANDRLVEEGGSMVIQRMLSPMELAWSFKEKCGTGEKNRPESEGDILDSARLKLKTICLMELAAHVLSHDVSLPFPLFISASPERLSSPQASALLIFVTIASWIIGTSFRSLGPIRSLNQPITSLYPTVPRSPDKERGFGKTWLVILEWR